MRITNEHVGRLLEAGLERAQRGARRDAQEHVQGRRPDVVSFSARAEDMRVALLAARASSPASGGQGAEGARLEALAQQVRGGTYRVATGRVIEAILRDLRG